MAILTNHQTNTLGSNVDTDLATFTDGTLSVAGTLDVTNFKVGGAQGTDGQVLTSTGSGVAWEAAGGGGGNAFGNLSVAGQATVAADTSTDTLTLVAGSNITLTTDASTDTVTITSSGSPSGSNPNGFPFSRVPTKDLRNNSGDPAAYWYPSDLVEHRNSGSRYTQNKMYLVPWVAPMAGTIAYLGSRVTTNSAASGEKIHYGIYTSCPSGVSGRGAGTPYQRLGFCTFSLNGAGTGNKLSEPTSDGTGSGSAVTVAQGELYYLAFGGDLSNYSALYVNSYRRNSMMPFTGHQMTGTDFAFFTNQLPSNSATATNNLAVTSSPPPSLFAQYDL